MDSDLTWHTDQRSRDKFFHSEDNLSGESGEHSFFSSWYEMIWHHQKFVQTRTKFMQKLRELKKWQKHVLYFKLVDYFHNFNFLSLAMEYIPPYRAILRQQWSILDQIGPATGPCGTILYLIWYYYPGQKCWIQTLIRIQLNPDLIRTLSRTDPISSVPNQDLTLSPMAYQILGSLTGGGPEISRK